MVIRSRVAAPEEDDHRQRSNVGAAERYDVARPKNRRTGKRNHRRKGNRFFHAGTFELPYGRNTDYSGHDDRQGWSMSRHD